MSWSEGGNVNFQLYGILCIVYVYSPLNIEGIVAGIMESSKVQTLSTISLKCGIENTFALCIG